MTDITPLQQFFAAAISFGGTLAIGGMAMDTYETFQFNKDLDPDEQGYRQPYFWEFTKEN